MMKNEVLIAKMELSELVDTFSNLADIKDGRWKYNRKSGRHHYTSELH